MEKIVSVSPNVTEYLKELVTILYEKEYFGFEEDAHQYVEKLKTAIYEDLPSLTHHEAPEELKNYGKRYVKIRGSKNTMWYVFFSNMKNRYLIQLIINNHVPQSKNLNEL